MPRRRSLKVLDRDIEVLKGKIVKTKTRYDKEAATKQVSKNLHKA